MGDSTEGVCTICNKPIEAAEKAEREVWMMIIIQVQEWFDDDQDEVVGDDDDGDDEAGV